MIVSPAPGKITKEHKVTDTYQFDPKGSTSSQDAPPAPPAPGPLTSAKDAVNDTAQSATFGASDTVDSLLK
ncbi:hypothetical protein ABTZ58_39320 [Streptomyces sp. NPDC094143]|uniref:hypothetical protein n=1 Tax=Streptomyces sp. NPDC094143 TaxID=3155310 RepID=UPI003331F33D